MAYIELARNWRTNQDLECDGIWNERPKSTNSDQKLNEWANHKPHLYPPYLNKFHYKILFLSSKYNFSLIYSKIRFKE